MKQYNRKTQTQKEAKRSRLHTYLNCEWSEFERMEMDAKKILAKAKNPYMRYLLKAFIDHHELCYPDVAKYLNHDERVELSVTFTKQRWFRLFTNRKYLGDDKI